MRISDWSSERLLFRSAGLQDRGEQVQGVALRRRLQSAGERGADGLLARGHVPSSLVVGVLSDTADRADGVPDAIGAEQRDHKDRDVSGESNWRAHLDTVSAPPEAATG